MDEGVMETRCCVHFQPVEAWLVGHRIEGALVGSRVYNVGEGPGMRGSRPTNCYLWNPAFKGVLYTVCR